MFWPFMTYFKTPLTDVSGPMFNHQLGGGFCAQIEMRAYNCLEAYGDERGQIKCKDLLDDFFECSTHTKEFQRVAEMLKERERQVKNGERQYAEGPKHDSYQL